MTKTKQPVCCYEKQNEEAGFIVSYAVSSPCVCHYQIKLPLWKFSYDIPA